MQKAIIFLSFLCFALSCGCVSKSKYNDVVLKLEQSQKIQADLKQENTKLGSEVRDLQYRNDYINSVIAGFEERIDTLEKLAKASKNAKSKLIAEMAAARQALKEKLGIKDLELESLKEQYYKILNRMEPKSGGETKKAEPAAQATPKK